MKRSHATRTGAIAAAILMSAFFVGMPVSAQESIDDSVDKTTTQSTTESTERKKAFQQQVETKRQQIQTQIEAKRQEISQKLSDTRLKKCQERQGKINTVIDGSKTRAQRVLERLQAVEARVREYYASKNPTLANYDALSTAIDDKEAAIVAAIEVTDQTEFDCATDNALRPGSIISETVRTQNAALKAYRDSIRDLIKAIREATKTTETTEEEQQ